MTTATEIYLKSEEITDVQKTINDMLDKLVSETIQQGDDGYTQVVFQLDADSESGKEWKMFIYYNADSDTFNYSYQDEDYWDTEIYRSVTREFVIAKMLEEAEEVGGFQWICVDF